MNIDERIEYAYNRRDDALNNGTTFDITYWNGYIDALRAIKRDQNNERNENK